MRMQYIQQQIKKVTGKKYMKIPGSLLYLFDNKFIGADIYNELYTKGEEGEVNFS